MTDDQNTSGQRKSLLSQRLGERTGKKRRGRRGRPPSEKNRKNISFFLQPEVIQKLDEAYHQLSLDLSGNISIDKATFREQVILKGLDYLPDIRDDFRRNRD